MKLLTTDLEEKLKEYPLGSQDGKLGNSKVIAKFFNPTGVGTWYIIEENSNDDMCRKKEYDINSNVICVYGTPMY